ncbi:hypothetical protein LTR85_011397 [Meristemomyces frigidus]|nr:hypothetical protein LTR85_011397 [Meristemomyces frigidus]
MPLWQIYHPEGTFADTESKRAFSADITNLYTSYVGLPAFYAIVQFIPMPQDTMWVGASNKTEKPFIRIVINHVAVVVTPGPEEDAAYKKTCELVDGVIAPHVQAKGYDWEYHISETERRLWKVNGLIPPPWKSETEREWARENRALPYEGDH